MAETEQNNSDERVVYKLKYKPRESKVKIFNEPIKVPKIESKVNTFEKVNYVPKGGSVVIESKPVKWEAQSKVNTFEKIKYKPGGGDVKIETFRLNWEAKSRVSQLLEQNNRSIDLASPRNHQVKMINEKLNWDNIKPKVNTLDRLSYTPTDNAGQTITYAVEPPPLNILNAKSKIANNSNYTPPTSNVRILDEKLKWEAKSNLNTFENIKYKPKAGSFKAVTQKLDFHKKARSKLDTGLEVVVIKKKNNNNNSVNNYEEDDVNMNNSENVSISNGTPVEKIKSWELKNNELIFHDITDNELAEYSESMNSTRELSNLSKGFLNKNEDNVSLNDKDR